MGIFLITPITTPEKVAESVKSNFAEDSYQIPNTTSWIIHFSGTTKELSDKLGITNGENGAGVVVAVSNYYGRASTDLWEWIQTRMERG